MQKGFVLKWNPSDVSPERQAKQVEELVKPSIKDFIENRMENPPEPERRKVTFALKQGGYSYKPIVDYSSSSYSWQGYGAPVADELRGPAEELWDKGLWWPKFVFTKSGGSSKVTRGPAVHDIAGHLARLAVDTVNYCGKWEFSQDAFREAYWDGLGGEIAGTRVHSTITPILNVEIEEDVKINLSITESAKRVGKGHDIESIEIVPLGKKEWAAMIDKANSPRMIGRPHYLPEDDTTHAIKVTAKGRVGPSIGDDLTDALITSLRIFDEGRHDFGVQVRYGYEKSWMDYRLNAIKFVSASKHLVGLAPWHAVSWKPEPAFFDKFPQFWEEWDVISTTKSGQLHIPASRFNQTYKKFDAEDRLVDLVIALESTILQEISSAELRYRMALRGAVIMGGGRETFNFLRGAYDARSKVVHEGKDVAKAWKIPPEGVRPQVLELRKIVSKIITQYARLTGFGLSVEEINQSIDEALLEAPWKPPGLEPAHG